MVKALYQKKIKVKLDADKHGFNRLAQINYENISEILPDLRLSASN
jgi:hypothetical protein